MRLRRRKRSVYSWRHLCSTAEALDKLLQKYHVDYWSKLFSQLNEEIQRYAGQETVSPGMLAVLRRLKAIYGGMGSFSDFSLDPRAGVKISEGEQRAADKQLYALRSTLYEIATQLETHP